MRPTIALVALLVLAALLRPAPPLARAADAFNPLAAMEGVLTLRVPRPGPVSISGAALARAGWDLAAIDPRGIHLFFWGVEQPLALEGADEAALTPATTLRFIAQAPHGRFADAAVYWLSHDLRLGLRGPLPAYGGEPLRWQQESRYEGRFGVAAGDHWFSGELFAGHSLSATLALAAPLAPGATLRLRLLGEERRAHTLALRANDVSLPIITWSDADAPAGRPRAHTATVTLPAPIPAGQLQIDLTLESAGLPTDVVLLDWIELPDARASAPTLIDPPLAPHPARDLRAGTAPNSAGAGYLIVSYADFLSALAPLLEAKRQAGRAPAIVDAQAAYDAWSYGERDPAAIRELVRAAMRWKLAPSAVLLVGAGSVRGSENFIPPFLVDADPWLGEVACDTCYARLDADDPRDDPLPNLPVGRFPVRTFTETVALVRKTVAYETAPPAGPWRENALFLADNDTLPGGAPDPVGGFVRSAEAAASLMEAAGLHAERLYYDPLGGDGRSADVAALRCALFAALDGTCEIADARRETRDTRRETAWTTLRRLSPTGGVPAAVDLQQPTVETWRQEAGNAASTDGGLALLTYIGHGSPWQWAQTALDAPTPYLWSLYDADARRNGGRLPILLAMTCLTGAWQNPDLPTTDERLLLTPGGGIVASLSATGMGVNAGHDAMLRGALPVLLSAGDRTLGAAHLAALDELLRTGEHLDLAFTYGILGDPDVALPRAAPWRAFLPFVTRRP